MKINQAFQARHTNDALSKLNTASLLDRVVEGASKSLLSGPGKQKEETRGEPRVATATPRVTRRQLCYKSLYRQDSGDVCVDKNCSLKHLNYYPGVDGGLWRDMRDSWSQIRDLPFRAEIKDDFDARARQRTSDDKSGNGRGSKRRKE